MNATTRPTIIVAAVTAGALAIGGAATATAGQGWGSNTASSQASAAASEFGQGQGQGHGQGKGQGQGHGQGKGQGQGQGNGQGEGQGHQDVSSLDLGALTSDQEAEMAFMAEEEKMAGDLYEAFFEMYGVKVFTNIAASEDRHADAVRDLLAAYDLDDPTVGMGAGEFTIPEVQQMYDELLAQGSASVEAALEVGVIVEETDIADLKAAVIGLDAPRAVAVYENLLAGSQNHLAAFSR